MRYKFASAFMALAFVWVFSVSGLAQNCTGRGHTPSLDCRSAISLTQCGKVLLFPTGRICGPGAVANEIPRGTCIGSGERNTTWFTFRADTAGLIRFSITPLDHISATDSGNTDYDFILLRLPPDSVHSINTCSLLPTSQWNVSCNFSAENGAMGMLDTTGMVNADNQSAAGTKWNRPIQAQAGETYILAIEQFQSGVKPGYVFRFSNRPGTVGIRTLDSSTAFIFTDVEASADSVTVTTNHMFECNRLVPGAVSIYDPQNPGRTYTITNFGPLGACENYTNRFRLRFAPYDSSDVGDLYLVIRDTLVDACNRKILKDTIQLRQGPRTSIRKAARLGSFTIFPQPNKGEFEIDLRSLPLNETLVSVYEAPTSKSVYTTGVQGGSLQKLSPSKLAPGFYLVEVRQGTHRLIQKMIVER